MRLLPGLAAVSALISLAGCVGAPAGPVAYQPPPPYPAPAPAPYGADDYPPPGPPAGAYQPPAAYAQPAAYGYRCYAGVYTCTLPQQLPVGAQCSCPGIGAPSYGNVR